MQVTILLTANATGDFKMKLLIINSAIKPRAFAAVQVLPSSLPVE